MSLQPPEPPPITPGQMKLLRVVTAMAWADGELAEAEVDVMLERFSLLFAKTDEQQQNLKQELRDYMMQNLPLEELIPKLETDAQRELVLALGYEVIACSARTPDEANINDEEAAAYQKLVDLLNLPADAVKRIENQVQADPCGTEGVVETMLKRLKAYVES
jgi:hypothetical protein